MTATKAVRPLGEVTGADLRSCTDEFAELIEEKLPLYFDQEKFGQRSPTPS